MQRGRHICSFPRPVFFAAYKNCLPCLVQTASGCFSPSLMLLVSHPKTKARFIKRSTPCCEAALVLTSENNWPNSVSSLGPKTLKFSGKHCVTYCAWQKCEAIKASKSPKVHVTMLFVFPMLSLKQCDMKVRGGLIFFPRWDWGIKKKNRRKKRILELVLDTKMSKSLGDSKSSATEICRNLRLNPVMPPAAVPGKYFCWYNKQ